MMTFNEELRGTVQQLTPSLLGLKKVFLYILMTIMGYAIINVLLLNNLNASLH